jgi:hypothetical protein
MKKRQIFALALVGAFFATLSYASASVNNPSASGSGGGVSTSTANTWTATQTGPFVDNGGQVFNVKAYGAKVDGVTDDSTAVQNALNACSSAAGGMVFIPQGSTVFHGITPKSNCIVSGAGLGATTILGGTNSGWTFYINSSTNPIVNAGFENMTIDLQNVANASGISLNNASNTFVNNVSFLNGAAGGWFLVYGSTNSTSTTVTNFNNSVNNVSFTNHAGTLEAFLLYNASGTNISNLNLKNVSSPGLGLWQGDQGTNISNVYCSAGSGKVIYVNITSDNTNITNEYANNCGAAVVAGVSGSDNGLFGRTQIQGLNITNVTAIGGSNSSLTTGLDLEGTNNLNVINANISHYDIGIGLTVGGGGVIDTNFSISGGSLWDNNAENANPALHPGLNITSSGTFNGLISGVNFYDDSGSATSGYSQQYPIAFNGSGSTTTFDGITIWNNRLAAANGGTSIRLQNSAVLGSNVRIFTNPGFSGTNPPQAFDVSTSTLTAATGSITALTASTTHVIGITTLDAKIASTQSGDQFSFQSGSAKINSTNGDLTFQTGFSGKKFNLQDSGGNDHFRVSLDNGNTIIGGNNQSASATLQLYDFTNNSSTLLIGASSTKQGCLEMGAASGTARLVYVWFDSNAAIFATTTKPAFCM